MDIMEEQNEIEQGRYEVEKIVSKRTLEGKVQYLLKWVGYSNKDNSWACVEDMECDELIEEFETKRVKCILGVALRGNEFVYVVGLRDSNQPIIVSARDIRKWNHLLFDYLIRRVEWTGFENQITVTEIEFLDVNAPLTTPEIFYITDMMGEIHFCIRFETGYKFAILSDVKNKWCDLAVDFLQEHLSFIADAA